MTSLPSTPARRDPSRPRERASALLALVLIVGCGGESVPTAGQLRPVKGKVAFKDAAALKGMKVQFLPNSPSARPASGELGPDGSFELKSPDGDGIAEGDYHVRLDRPAGPKGKPAPTPIPAEYFDEDGAFLTATVKSDTTELPAFDVNKAVLGPAKGGRGRARPSSD